MRHKVVQWIFLCFFILGITGCAPEEKLPDTYIAGSDHQYMYYDRQNYFSRQAEGEKGYYLLQGNYIYYIDKDSKNVIPLCSKADCLHNSESDEDKYSDCNAYVANNGMVQISYCNGYLYYINEDYINEEFVLYRLKEDGSSREVLKRWKDCAIKQWIVHRDRLYYIEVDYSTGENGKTLEHYYIKSLSLKGNFQKIDSETIYTPDENLYVLDVSWPQAYGNHFYFQVLGYTTLDADSVTDENYQDYLYMKTFEYDLLDGSLHDIWAEEELYVQGVTFWQNRIIVFPGDQEMERGEQAVSYIADLDGSNRKVFSEEVLRGQLYLSDEEHLYLSNSILVLLGIENQQQYIVYNSDNEKIDTIGMPFQGAGDPEIGGTGGMFLAFGDENDTSKWYIEYFDKSTLGSYQGSALQTTRIADMTYNAFELSQDASIIGE